MMNEIGNHWLSTNAPKLLAIVQPHARMQEAQKIVFFFLKNQGHNSKFGISNSKVHESNKVPKHCICLKHVHLSVCVCKAISCLCNTLIVSLEKHLISAGN